MGFVVNIKINILKETVYEYMNSFDSHTGELALLRLNKDKLNIKLYAYKISTILLVWLQILHTWSSSIVRMVNVAHKKIDFFIIYR